MFVSRCAAEHAEARIAGLHAAARACGHEPTPELVLLQFWRELAPPAGPPEYQPGPGQSSCRPHRLPRCRCLARWVGKDLAIEAAWEFAARGGLEGKEFAWGNSCTLAASQWPTPGRASSRPGTRSSRAMSGHRRSGASRRMGRVCTTCAAIPGNALRIGSSAGTRPMRRRSAAFPAIRAARAWKMASTLSMPCASHARF